MFLLFLQIVFPKIDTTYSLTPPFLHTGIREIGNWSLVGQIISQKRILHFTTNVKETYGGICNRLPTVSKDWMSEIELQLIKDLFIFTFSKFPCPNTSTSFIGLTISLIPRNNQMNIELSGTEIFPSNICSFEYSTDEPLRIRIYKKENTLIIKYITKSNTVQDCLMQNLTHLYEYGYISMFGHTVGCSDCKSDLISETFIPTSDYSPIQNWEKISNRSRKSINKFLYGNRTPQKMYRRAKMLTISNYISQIKNSNSTLSESEIIKLSDAFNEVNEMILRANECVSADQLKTFIDKKMVPSLNNASARFERVKDALWSMRTEFIDLWEGAKSQLKGINSEIRKEFIQIENEALEMANEIKGEMKEIETKIPKRKKSSFPMFLFCLCVIEFVAYFVFLLKNYSKITTKKIL